MTRLLFTALCGWVALGALGSGCLAYNDSCQALVDDPNERVAFIASGTEVWLDRPNARHGNNAIGQVEADGFVWVFRDSGRPVDFAVVNGGSIRAEGLCVTRNILPDGPLTNGVLHEVLLFENLVQAVDVGEDDVLAMFEHSVERLFESSATIVSPSGQFLQVSDEVSLEVDCAQPAGQRVTSLSIGGVAITRPGRPISERRLRFASSSFVVQGGDDYTMLAHASASPQGNLEQAKRFGGIDSNITTAYLKQSPMNESAATGIRVDDTRVRFTNCAVPTRPR